MRIIVLSLIALAALGQNLTEDPFAHLWIYAGTWQVTAKNRAAGAKPDTLVNQCGVLGRYFACGQTINGQPGGLVVFIPAGKPDHYFTQTILPEGRATGRDDLEISGDQWIYSSRRDQGGRTTFYRNVNTFTGKNRIHFEQAQSTNGTQWATENSGDEVRVGPTPRGAR